jgi:hypothetical protein
LQGVSTVCFDPITGLFGNEGGSHDPAVIVGSVSKVEMAIFTPPAQRHSG